MLHIKAVISYSDKLMSYFSQFSELPEICQIIILSFTDVPTFKNICSIRELNLLHSEFPNAERLYEERSRIHFAKYLSYKEEKMKWKEFYERIINLLPTIASFKAQLKTSYYDANQIIIDNHLMELKICSEHHNKYPNGSNISTILYHGHVDILEWAYNLRKYHDMTFFSHVPRKNIMQILKWYEEKKLLSSRLFCFSDYMAHGTVEALEWLHERNFIWPFSSIQHVVENGNLENLKWFHTKLNYPLYENFINTSLTFGHIDITEWLITKFPNYKPNPYIAVNVAVHGRLNSLIWLEKHGITFTAEVANSAWCWKRKDILEWLAERNIIPNKHKNLIDIDID